MKKLIIVAGLIFGIAGIVEAKTHRHVHKHTHKHVSVSMSNAGSAGARATTGRTYHSHTVRTRTSCPSGNCP